MDSITQQNSSLVDNSALASRKMSDYAQQLMNTLAVFRLDSHMPIDKEDGVVDNSNNVGTDTDLNHPQRPNKVVGDGLPDFE